MCIVWCDRPPLISASLPTRSGRVVPPGEKEGGDQGGRMEGFKGQRGWPKRCDLHVADGGCGNFTHFKAEKGGGEGGRGHHQAQQ